MLLGIVALRAGKKIEYDGANMRVTNLAAANDYLHSAHRAPAGDRFGGRGFSSDIAATCGISPAPVNKPGAYIKASALLSSPACAVRRVDGL